MLPICVLLTFLLCSSTVFAARYAFSFTTSGSQVGGYGTKIGGDSSASLVIDPTSNTNSSRYISAYVGSMDWIRLSGYMTIDQPGATRGTLYSDGGTDYGGGVNLIGTPSAVGASSTGTWYP